VLADRDVRLRVAPGTNRIEGEWIRREHYFWITSDHRTCHLFADETQFTAEYHAAWLSSLSGEYDPDKRIIRIKASYVQCEGNGCSHVKTAPSSGFSTELEMRGSRLVDTNATPDPSDDLEFIRVTDASDEIEEARAALAPYLRVIDSGDAGPAYQNAMASAYKQSVPPEKFQSWLAEMQSANGPTVSRRSLYSTRVLYVPMHPKEVGDYVLFINGIKTSKQIPAVEYIFAMKEGSVWKISIIIYGS
jgi:hypothetical protein